MISVVIPAFNEGEGIEACLKSVCDQTLPRDQYEVIVVDGNSKDNTREIAAKYADKVFIQTSKKVGGARNDGVMEAKYDWIVTADADCFFPRTWLETIVNDFKNHPEAATFYHIKHIGTVIEKCPVNPVHQIVIRHTFKGRGMNLFFLTNMAILFVGMPAVVRRSTSSTKDCKVASS